MADIRRLIETGVHPPSKRSALMEVISSARDIYWRLKQ
jgi:hypothetical protein